MVLQVYIANVWKTENIAVIDPQTLQNSNLKLGYLSYMTLYNKHYNYLHLSMVIPRFWIFLWWPIHIINSVDKTKLSMFIPVLSSKIQNAFCEILLARNQWNYCRMQLLNNELYRTWNLQINSEFIACSSAGWLFLKLKGGSIELTGRGSGLIVNVSTTLDRAARVGALARDIVLCSNGQDTLLSQCLSPSI